MGKKMQVLTISRRRWLTADLKHRNGDRREGELLASDGKMCCLGFVARQMCDAKPKQIRGEGRPSHVHTLSWPRFLRPINIFPEGCMSSEFVDTSSANKLMEINDAEYLTRRERESAIRKIFAKHGVRVKFVP